MSWNLIEGRVEPYCSRMIHDTYLGLQMEGISGGSLWLAWKYTRGRGSEFHPFCPPISQSLVLRSREWAVQYSANVLATSKNSIKRANTWKGFRCFILFSIPRFFKPFAEEHRSNGRFQKIQSLNAVFEFGCKTYPHLRLPASCVTRRAGHSRGRPNSEQQLAQTFSKRLHRTVS